MIGRVWLSSTLHDCLVYFLLSTHGERVLEEELSRRNALYPFDQAELARTTILYPLFVGKEHDSGI